MNLITSFIIWIWLLGISLIVPTSLPAGGSQKSNIHHRENNIGSPLIAFKQFNLLTSAINDSSILTKVKVGTPVNVLKIWETDQNGKWLLVNVLSDHPNQFFYKRGWINIGTS
tara:strand:+ start:144 stop:482 length:339 start_codon:yes stop_codon:yes gene_type:complete